MRTVLRTGALRDLRTSASTSLHSNFRNLRGRTTCRLPAVSCYGFHSKSQDCSEALGTAAQLPEAEPVLSAPPRERITIADIKERRAKAGRLIAPTASYSDADMFKAPTVGKPKAKRWDHHLTKESTLREPCKLKQAAKHLKQPGLISLGGGLPCPEYFPISSLTLHIPRPPHFSEAATLADGEDVTIGKYDASSSPPPPPKQSSPEPPPPSRQQVQQQPEYDLSIALNYAQATGSAQMTRFVTEHTELVHGPIPYADWRVCLTVGSTSALEQTLRMLCDGGGVASRRDSLLTEEFSFSTALETAAPLGVGVVGVRMDEQGLLPGDMERILDCWEPGLRGGRRKPHVLYTVPSGQNPTGATQGEQRRREIYEVARRHDVFIVEDEPYYYLQMPDKGNGKGEGRGVATTGDVEEFLEGLIPSYLSMDVDGRVLRMDSFSKVVVPGSRLGWVTASEQIIERFIRHAEVANQGPSGFSQVILHKLLDERWGHEGYLRWLMNLRMEYAKRRDVMVEACDEFLPRELVTWNTPQAGMFHWLKVNHELHPHASTKSILEMEEEIFNSCISRGVLVARGSWFRAEQDRPPPGLYFRATFAAATPENMREAIRRLGEAIRESYQI
ncbi:PLP-dependent transferase [Parathielavia appendiculata]|uniref:aromatic-amino-acid transaminase n=1 Tax=Parathielavia appendiculata TaxID=2587402 RepID=A0AAN6UAM3_9PEZI|nr:PLP-dependent transferase [Parathielavia appendiculata]